MPTARPSISDSNGVVDDTVVNPVAAKISDVVMPTPNNAVSNGINTLREPRVQTGKRTMIYMGASLSFVVGGLLLAYLLYNVTPVEGQTLNAVLFEKITAAWPPLFSRGFVIAAMVSSAALLFIAAQTGFFGGPRVLANMAVDRWMPTRFATSRRVTP